MNKIAGASSIVKINDELQVEVVTDVKHEWLLSTKDVAEGYGLSESGLRSTKSRNEDEFEEGTHFITSVSNRDAGGPPIKSTMWTKEGVVVLGFFIKTEMAKGFRKWASKFIIENSSPTFTATTTNALPNFTNPAEAARAWAKQYEVALIAKQQLELVAPKVEVYDALMDTDVKATYTISKVAKQLGYGRDEFFNMLRRDNIIFQHSSCPKSSYDQMGYFDVTVGLNEDSKYTYQNYHVTPSGLEFFFRKYGKKELSA